ncbi:hypothetical protein [Gimesia maris]|uniref:hypothetical protein n=1 Tax=Gimesia maris TaxID=122 RepID=UPI003A95565B
MQSNQALNRIFQVGPRSLADSIVMNKYSSRQNPYLPPTTGGASSNESYVVRFLFRWSASLSATLAGTIFLSICWGSWCSLSASSSKTWGSTSEPIWLSGIVIGGLSAITAQMLADGHAVKWLVVVSLSLVGISLPQSLHFDIQEYWGILLALTTGFVLISLMSARASQCGYFSLRRTK